MKPTLENYLMLINKLGGKSRPLIFESPASESAVSAIEDKLRL